MYYTDKRHTVYSILNMNCQSPDFYHSSCVTTISCTKWYTCTHMYTTTTHVISNGRCSVQYPKEFHAESDVNRSMALALENSKPNVIYWNAMHIEHELSATCTCIRLVALIMLWRSSASSDNVVCLVCMYILLFPLLCSCYFLSYDLHLYLMPLLILSLSSTNSCHIWWQDSVARLYAYTWTWVTM